MALVVGVFADRERALAAIEALRAARFDTDRVRVVGGPGDAGELGGEAGPGASVAAGPTEPVVGGLLEGSVPRDQLRSIEDRVGEGAVLLVADDLEESAAQELVGLLRAQGAQDVAAPGQT